jgi:hypothetical protein
MTDAPDHLAQPRYLSARQRLDTLFELGCSWERIEATIKNVVELTEEQRAGLWLYGFLRHQSHRLGTAAPRIAALAGD